MRALIVIPARMGSSRLPGKPLLAETGRPMIQHVHEAASRVPNVRVLVATDDERVARAVRAFGGEAVMTAADHQTGGARVAEAAAGTPAPVVVNLQGDEPEVEPGAIVTLIGLHEAAMAAPRPAFVSTLVSAFPDGADPGDPDTVKAVLSEPDGAGVRSAMWFSRAPIPYPRGDGPDPRGEGPGEEGTAPLLHVGLYAYSPGTLAAFAAMPRTPLERTESLEQLRVLEHGHRIAAAVVPPAAPGIDTRAEYDAFVARQRARG